MKLSELTKLRLMLHKNNNQKNLLTFFPVDVQSMNT